MDAARFNEDVQRLVVRWCDRRELSALGALLPAWLVNNGMTDGWAELASALGSISHLRRLPPAERDQVKRLWIELDTLLRSR
jgi:hypothetical protein